jgi:hypothetical protein
MTPAADLSACACACHSSYNETVLRYFGRRRRREAEAVQFGLIIAYQPQRASRPRATRQSLAISCSGCRSRDALRNIGFGYAAPAKKTAATNSGMSCANKSHEGGYSTPPTPPPTGVANAARRPRQPVRRTITEPPRTTMRNRPDAQRGCEPLAAGANSKRSR